MRIWQNQPDGNNKAAVKITAALLLILISEYDFITCCMFVF